MEYNELMIPVADVIDLEEGLNHLMNSTTFERLLGNMKPSKFENVEGCIPVSIQFTIRSIYSNKVLVVYHKNSGVNCITSTKRTVNNDGVSNIYISLLMNIKSRLKAMFKAGFESAMTTSTLQPVGVSLMPYKRLVMNFIIYVEDKYATESYFEMLEGLNYECEFMDIKEAISLDNIDTYSNLMIPLLTVVKEEKGETR